MLDRHFWALIETVDTAALLGGADDRAVEPLEVALEALPPSEIEAFEEHLAAKLHALDGRRFCDEAGAAKGSADGFLYARCFVVARGERHYVDVLSDPTKMPKSLEEWCEPLLHVARKAYERSTGREWDFFPSLSPETGDNEQQWE